MLLQVCLFIPEYAEVRRGLLSRQVGGHTHGWGVGGVGSSGVRRGVWYPRAHAV